MATYTIDVLRKTTDGILTFKSGTVSISEKCWWDPDMVIVAGNYTGYATRMTNKDDGTDGGKREGIWLGTGVKYNGGKNSGDGAFIHKGTSPSWSDGCIVMAGAKVYQMWSEINPKETGNISVTIRDEKVARGGRMFDWDCACGPALAAIGRDFEPRFAIGGALALGAPVWAAPDPGDATEIIETLIGAPTSRHETPLARMQGRGLLYAKYRDAAAMGDGEATRLWLLIGATAILRVDSAISQGFSGDIVPVFQAAPDAVLTTLNDAPWLVASTCFYLGAYFDFEDRDGEGREAFLDAETGRISGALAEPLAQACLTQIRTPKRPEFQ